MAAPAPELIQTGLTFHITNAKAGTAMDLSGSDGRSIIGWPSHNGANQKWKINWTGHGWTFQNEYSGLFLGLNGTPADGTRLVGVTSPFEWHIWHDEVDPTFYRVYVPETHFNLDLFGNGRTAPGTPITLWSAWAGIHQTWKFERV